MYIFDLKKLLQTYLSEFNANLFCITIHNIKLEEAIYLSINNNIF